MCDIGDGFAAAWAKSPLQSTVGHSQRSKGCSALSQAEKDCKSAKFSSTKDGDSSLWISDEYKYLISRLISILKLGYKVSGAGQ